MHRCKLTKKSGPGPGEGKGRSKLGRLRGMWKQRRLIEDGRKKENVGGDRENGNGVWY